MVGCAVFFLLTPVPVPADPRVIRRVRSAGDRWTVLTGGVSVRRSGGRVEWVGDGVLVPPSLTPCPRSGRLRETSLGTEVPRTTGEGLGGSSKVGSRSLLGLRRTRTLVLWIHGW